MTSRSDRSIGTSEDGRLTQRAVTLARSGASEGVHFLYVRYADDVLRCVTSIVPDRDRAEDITRSVFAELTATIQGYEPQGAPFRTWILPVARNAALDRLRAERRVPAA